MTETMTLAGKIYIVTGANAGIGYATSKQLVEQGATVIMACRSQERGETARTEIVRATGNQQVHMMLMDMASLASIREFAAAFNQRFERLDGLINNAAHFDLTQTEPLFTPEGAESVFATNHLGPFLLTNLLLNKLKASAPASVVNISSMGLLTYPFLKVQFADLTTSKTRKYKVPYAYYHSKLAHVMFTRELARKLAGTGVVANAIRVPNVRVDVSRYPDLPEFMLKMYAVKQRFAITPEQMAEVYVKVAAAPEYETLTGAYIDEKLKQVKLPGFAGNDDACRQLWEVSASMVGLP